MCTNPDCAFTGFKEDTPKLTEFMFAALGDDTPIMVFRHIDEDGNATPIDWAVFDMQKFAHQFVKNIWN